MSTLQGVSLVHAIGVSSIHAAAMPFKRGDVIVRVTNFGQFVEHKERWSIEFTDRRLPKQYSWLSVNPNGFVSTAFVGVIETLSRLGVPALQKAWRPL